MSTQPANTIYDLSKMTRAERYKLATKIISGISQEWMESPDDAEWEKENVEEYHSKWSFDELAAELLAVTFRP